MKKLQLLLTAVLLFSGGLLAQRTITGKVTDINGNPVVNASVYISNSTSGTITQADGSFSLTIPAGTSQIEVSSIGYANQTVNITQANDYNIILVTEETEIQAVVITGYGRIKKSEYVGAASKIDSKAIELVPIGSFDQILQGRAPGLRVTAGSGQPGASASVQIRGPKSIGGGSTPLYVIDGVPVEAGVFNSYNPNDFATVDIIKDGSAAALYGNRGASGVIVITTKRGKRGKTSFSYRSQYGVTEPGTQRFDMMNSAEALQFQENLGKLVNTGLPGWVYSRSNPANASLPASTLAQYDAILDSLRGINENWQDIFQRSGSFYSHDLNISGGSDQTRFYASLGTYKEDGIGERSDLERYTLRFNLDHQTDKLTFQLNSTIGYSNRSFIESENGVALANPFAAAYLAMPYQKLYNADTIQTGSGRTGANAFQRIRDIQRYNNQLKGTVSMIASYNITENFYVGGNAGVDFRETDNTTFYKPNTWTTSQSSFPTSTGLYSEGMTRYTQGNARGYVGYKNVFNDVHSVDVSFHSEYIHQRTKAFNYTGYGLNDKLPNTPAAITPGTVDNRLIPVVGGGKSERNYVSVFGMFKYGYDDKYIVDVTIRRDGTSVLPEDNRFENFYAVGVIWNVLRENFSNNWDNISTLRVRGSYGTSANAENFGFGDFGYFPLYGSGSYAGIPTLVPTTPGNDKGTWEFTRKINFGVEAGAWRDRLYGEVNLYNEETVDLFITQNIDPSNGGGFTSAQINAGKMRNRGFEVNLSYDIIRKKNIRWNVYGNVAYNDNEITSLGQEREYPQGTEIVRVGIPLGSHFINKWAGVDAATGRPLYYTKDGKVTDEFNSDDQVAEFGTYYAPWTGGFGTNFSYKGFELSAFFNFQNKFSRFNNQDFFQLNHAFAQAGYNMRKEMLTMWSQPGDVTNIQSPQYQRQFSSKDIQDASYLRFRNLHISYTFPENIINKLKVVQSIKIYGQAQNLYTWTKWTGFDPEDNDNIAQYEYPLPRIYTAGLDITF